MPLEFIDNDTISNHGVRKRIRSHAALGRNKGKKLCRASRKNASKTAMTLIHSPATEGAPDVTKRVCRVERPIDDGLFFLGFQPGESKALIKKVIAFMSTMQLSPALSSGLSFVGINPPLCVQYMFVDEACFHSTMATAIICLDKLVSRPNSALLSMRHASNTFRLVNRKLSGQTATSDLTIAAVISMAQYEQLQNRYQQGSVHVQGLRQIAQLRGGVVRQLMTSPSHLVQKMLRTDLEYSLQLGSPTVFTVKEASIICQNKIQLPSLHLRQESGIPPLSLDRQQYTSLSAPLRDLLMDALFLTSLLNSTIAGVVPKINAAEFYKCILLLGYRLMGLQPLRGLVGVGPFSNGLHLGLKAFLLTFLQWPDGRAVESELMPKMLSNIQQVSMGGQDSQEVHLWLSFIGAASSYTYENPIWISITRHTLEGLGIKSWEHVKQILTKFPWINALHDPAGQKFWCSLQRDSIL